MILKGCVLVSMCVCTPASHNFKKNVVSEKSDIACLKNIYWDVVTISIVI